MSRLAILLVLVGCQSQPKLEPVSTFVVTEIEGTSIESRAATTPESSSGNALPLTEQQQPRDGAARDFQTEDELRLQLGLKSMALAEARKECEELERRVKDLKDSVDKLTAGRIAELDSLATVGDSLPMVTIIGSASCGPCRAWKSEANDNPGTVPKRFVDFGAPGPGDIDEVQWATIIGAFAMAGNQVPFVFWQAKSGQIKWLVGRYSDKQLEWSIREADKEDAKRQKKPQPVTRPSSSIASRAA